MSNSATEVRDYALYQEGTIIKVNPSTNWKTVEKMINYKTIQGMVKILMEPGVYTTGANFKYAVGDIIIQRDPAFPESEAIVFQTSNVYKEELTDNEYNTFFSFERCYRVFIDDIRFEFIGSLDYIAVATYTEFHLTKVQMNTDMLIKYGKNVVMVDCKKNEGFTNIESEIKPDPAIHLVGLCKIFFDEKSKDFTCFMEAGCEGYSYGSGIGFINKNTKRETLFTTNYIQSSMFDLETNDYQIREAIEKGEGFTIGKEDVTKVFELIGKTPDK